MEAVPISGTLCACSSVRRASRALGQLYDAILAPSGLTTNQYALLNNLSEERAIGMGDLAERLVMDRTTLTRALAPLEREGWVVVEPGEDRRTRRVRLAAAGAATRDAARPLWREAQAHVAMKFGEDRLATLRRELAELTALVR